MAGKLDEVKGRVKEAAGAALDDDKLRAEGQKDQAVGHAKNAVEKAKEAGMVVFDVVRKSYLTGTPIMRRCFSTREGAAKAASLFLRLNISLAPPVPCVQRALAKPVVHALCRMNRQSRRAGRCLTTPN